MEKVIKKAIEGGYQPHNWIKKGGQKITAPEVVMSYYYHQPTYLFDPLFWQALGKSLGWKEKIHKSAQNTIIKDLLRHGTCNWSCQPEWLHHWHRFISALAEGKSPDDFFNNLLKWI